MHKKHTIPPKKIHPPNLFFFISVTVILLSIYSNTFQSPWQLDDPPNITNNRLLHINNLMPETLWQTFHAKPFAPGVLHRPVANFTFALNWYIGRDNPLGYHIVNVLIHILTSLILYHTILLLFQTPALKKYSQQDAFFIAILATTFWAINPIQTQAITYIVQRMASLAAMFYIWAIFWYLNARLSETISKRRLNIVLCVICFSCAIGSKQNAAILPLSILLTEYTFFPKSQAIFSKNILKLLLIIACTIILAYIYYLVQQDQTSFLFKLAETRPFTIYERLLTEPGIILFYLSLIFYPLYQRFSIEHDVTVVHSLFSSWTALPAILVILGFIIYSLCHLRKHPLFSFAILFFFINHLIESTIIPLELLFEHRNYLPSMFLFLPIAAGLNSLLKIYAHSSRIIYICIFCFIPLLLIITGWNTYLRNNVWTSKESLWQDALQKAPNSGRPLAKLAELAGWSKERNPKQLTIAIGYYEKALSNYNSRTAFKAAILSNMGELFFIYGLYEQAITYYSKALLLDPGFYSSKYGLAKTLVVMGKFDGAFKEILSALKTDFPPNDFLNLGGLILLWQNKPDRAILAFSKAMQLSGVKHKYFYNLGVAFSKAGYYDQAEWFLKLSRASSTDLRILFSLLENSVRAADQQQSDYYAQKIILQFSIASIEHSLKNLKTDYRIVPISTELIATVLHKHLQQQVGQLTEPTATIP